MLDEWERSGGVFSSAYGWPGLGRVAPAATVDDLDRLRDIRASFFVSFHSHGSIFRTLDDCLAIDLLLAYLGRLQYRSEIGVTQKVEAVARP